MIWSIVYFSSPFTSQHFLQIRTQFNEHLCSSYPKVCACIVARQCLHLFDFFPLKEKIPALLRSHVIYCFKCQSSGASYKSGTCRHLNKRISNHMRILARAGKNVVNPFLYTSILSHQYNTRHLVVFDDFIIPSCSSLESELLLHQSLLINKVKPSFNGTLAQHFFFELSQHIFLLVFVYRFFLHL